MTNTLWDGLKFHAGIAGDNFLKKSTVGKVLAGLYDSVDRQVNPQNHMDGAGNYYPGQQPGQLEDAFNVAGSAMVGGMPFAPPGTGILAAGFKPPNNVVDAYKIFNVKSKSPGEIFPMFIGANKPTPIGEWVEAEFLPTSGFADRGGWHAGVLPVAPHLMKKTGQMPENRVWAKVSMPNDVDWNAELARRGLKDLRGELPVGGTYDFKTNKMLGDAWKIGGALRVDNVLSDEEVAAILAEHNLIPALPRDSKKSKAYLTLMEMLGKK